MTTRKGYFRCPLCHEESDEIWSEAIMQYKYKSMVDKENNAHFVENSIPELIEEKYFCPTEGCDYKLSEREYKIFIGDRKR